MEQPVDLTNLRDITDGDVEMERELFKEFFSSFESRMSALHPDGPAEEWRAQSHSLKGMALNLGAQKLGELCKKGEAEPHAAPEQKNEQLKNIRLEYEKVRQFLLGIMSS